MALAPFEFGSAFVGLDRTGPVAEIIRHFPADRRSCPFESRVRCGELWSVRASGGEARARTSSAGGWSRSPRGRRISKSHLSEIESGRKQPRLELIERYSDEFGIPTSSILFFSECLDNPSKSASTANRGRGIIARKIITFLRIGQPEITGVILRHDGLYPPNRSRRSYASCIGSYGRRDPTQNAPILQSGSEADRHK